MNNATHIIQPVSNHLHIPEDWPTWFSGLHASQHAMLLTGDMRLERARAFIETHYSEPLDLDTIARCAFLSRYHFLRQFRRAYGLTPHQYLTQQRMRGAQKLLQETNLSITQVCYAVGFQSLGSFSDLFRRQIGCPPSRYRRRYTPVAWQPLPAIPCCFLAMFGRR